MTSAACARTSIGAEYEGYYAEAIISNGILGAPHCPDEMGIGVRLLASRSGGRVKSLACIKAEVSVIIRGGVHNYQTEVIAFNKPIHGNQ